MIFGKESKWEELLHDCEQSLETHLRGGQFKKVKTDTVLILCRKKAENTRWDYLTQVEKECKEKEKPSYDTETDPSEGLMNVLKKIYEDGDDDMKRTINKAWVESREKQAKGDTEF